MFFAFSLSRKQYTAESKFMEVFLWALLGVIYIKATP